MLLLCNIFCEEFGIKWRGTTAFEREEYGYPYYQNCYIVSCRNVFPPRIDHELRQYIPSLKFPDLPGFLLSIGANSGILTGTYE
jgi:hypothetical protein